MRRRDAIGAIGSAVVAMTAGCARLDDGSTTNPSEEESAADDSWLSDDGDDLPAEESQIKTIEDPWRGVTVMNADPGHAVIVTVRSISVSRSRTFERTIELGPGEELSFPDATPDTGRYRVAIELPQRDVEQKTIFDAEPHNTLVVSLDGDTISFTEIVTDVKS